jgi:hypothetical protein
MMFETMPEDDWKDFGHRTYLTHGRRIQQLINSAAPETEQFTCMIFMRKRNTISSTDTYLAWLMICSKGLEKSFRNLSLEAPHSP